MALVRDWPWPSALKSRHVTREGSASLKCNILSTEKLSPVILMKSSSGHSRGLPLHILCSEEFYFLDGWRVLSFHCKFKRENISDLGGNTLDIFDIEGEGEEVTSS